MYIICSVSVSCFTDTNNEPLRHPFLILASITPDFLFLKSQSWTLTILTSVKKILLYMTATWIYYIFSTKLLS